MGDGLPPYAQKSNPLRAMKMIPNPELEINAQTVEAKLKSVFDSV
jgi:hypothetical protein